MTDFPDLDLPLSTKRLQLRAHSPADADSLHPIYARDDVARYLLDDPWSPEDASRHVHERIAKTGLSTEPGTLALVIEHDGDAIGDVLLWLTDREHRTAEIGWVLDPDHSGRGFAAEAVGEALRLAFDHYRLHRVAAQMDARNTASARLAVRAGMQQEAHLRQDWWSKGEWTDTLIFAMLASDRVSPPEQSSRAVTTRPRHLEARTRIAG